MKKVKFIKYFNYYLNNRKYYLNIFAEVKNNEIFITVCDIKNFENFNIIYEYKYRYTKKSYKYYILKALKNINLKCENKLKLISNQLKVYEKL